MWDSLTLQNKILLLQVNSSPTYRIIESFEAIVVALLLDENFGSQSLSFQGDDVALLAERVIVYASSWSNYFITTQLYIYRLTVRCLNSMEEHLELLQVKRVKVHTCTCM